MKETLSSDSGDMIMPQEGDIWAELDPRFSTRMVKVIRVGPKRVAIHTVYRGAGAWIKAGPTTWPKLSRFNGKRGGYMLHARGFA